MHKCNLVVYIWRIGVLVLVGTLGAACQASMIASPSPTLPPPPPLASNPLPFPLPEATPGTAELPDFLLSINAGWRGLIFQDEMKSTLIWAQLDLATLVELDPTLIPEEAELVKRITLFTNGQPQTTRLSYIPPNRSVNIIYLYGEFTLDPGTYEAAVVVQLASGATLEHRWPFTVVPELVWPGLPAGVYVSPLPESTISQKAYQRSSFIPPQYFPCGGGGICLGLETWKIVERGEILGCVEVLRKVHLIALDGGRPTPEGNEVSLSCELEKSFETDTGGQIITSCPGPHAVEFWPIDLPPGEHLVVAELTRASGKPERFAWRFTITED